MDWLDYGGVKEYYLKGEVSKEKFAEEWANYFGEEIPAEILEAVSVRTIRKVPCNNGEYGFYAHDAEEGSRGSFKITAVFPYQLSFEKNYAKYW